MKAKIEFEHLYEQPFILETKTDIVQFFKEVKEQVCTALQTKSSAMTTLYKERPIWEKIVVNALASHKEVKRDGYVYQGTFEVKGLHTKNVYDRITVELEDVEFLERVVSMDDYLSIMFKMHYSGFFMTIEDVLKYSKVSRKMSENDRMMNLCKIDHLAAKESETHVDKVKRLAMEFGRLVGKKPFEIYYGLGSIEQRVFYVYDEKEHFSFLCHLIDRTRTHDIKIRLIDNEIAEWFQLAKGLYQTKIRKVAV